ncbi:MAG: hypothetical protein ACXU9U_05655, partial [Parachlamydiaceae bacterium]
MFSSPVGPSSATCSPLNSRHQSFFERLEQYITHTQFGQAQNELFALFRRAQSEDEIRHCYQFLLDLLPHCSSLSVLENNLPNLLEKSVLFAKEQEQLALALGNRYLQEGELKKQEGKLEEWHEQLKKAMLCFAKALQMNRSQDNYLAALNVFVYEFQAHQEQRLNAFLINPTPSPDTVGIHVKTVEALKTFGIPKEVLSPFFEKITDRINNVPQHKHADYQTLEETASDLRNSSWELQQTPIERYWEALQTFRACFANDGARTIQKEAFDAMK